MGAVVFFHAHPDDEAIFTGGTIALLSDSGHRTVVVVATSGELGSTYWDEEALYPVREAEARRSCELLGVRRVEFLGYADSGIGSDAATRPAGAFGDAPIAEAAARLAVILADEEADALVIYDEGGIYGHPDHLNVHQVGLAAATATGVEIVYEATIDREYLHFVETHLIGHAVVALTDPAPAGVPSVLLSATVDVRPVIERKRAAMAAHASQIPADAEVLQMDGPTFAAVYGYEWFIRRGAVGPIDRLAM